MDAVSEYLSDIIREFNTGVAKEHSYRPALKALFESIADNITAINEPARSTFGAPDFLIKHKENTIGFVEAKDIGICRLDNLSDREIEQKERYLDALPNLIYTDYLEFRFFRNGKETARVRIADFDGNSIIAQTDKFQSLIDLLKDFYIVKSATIKSPLKLAELMAGKARLIADVIKNALTEQFDNKSLYDQLDSFRKILIRTMTEQEFADIYAQTIAYGMFVARLHDKTLENFTRQEAATLIPKTVPFLRKMFDYIAGNDIDERIVWSVDSLAEIFSYTDIADILKDFGRKTKTTDPIIHFYETFLSKYDKSLRKMRGVYYTPQPIVDYIVRAVDYILKSDFKITEGLADKSKITKKIIVQGATKPIEREFHRVQLLDPATGTGTFLATTINYIYRKFENNTGIWPAYVNNDLLPRMHGFEIMMSSYTMAHLKLDLVLRETGYIQDNARINDKIFRQDNLFDTELATIGRNASIQNSTNRVGIYLTNSLEEADPDTQTLWAAQWLSDEAKEANNIKQNVPVMCVLGNPPYSVSSANNNDFAKGLIEKYKTGLNERNIQPLSDDYIKFIALGQHYIEKNGSGVLAYISNNSFLDGVIHRQMRKSLMETFDKIYIVNLHGNTRLHESALDGTKDENVFDIMAGVSVNIFVKTSKSKKLANVFYRDLYGKRDIKYAFLNERNLQSSEFKLLNPIEPYYFFIEKNFEKPNEYNSGFKVEELFNTNASGLVTQRDNLLIQFEKDTLETLKTDIKNLDSKSCIQKYSIGPDERDWKFEYAKKDILSNDSFIISIGYRPFDTRYTLYTGTTKGIMAYPRHNVMQHMLSLNCALCLPRTTNHIGAYITNLVSDKHYIGGQTYIFPLYTYLNDEKTPNLNKQIVRNIESKVGQTTPESIFDYIYGVLHSPSYREKYREFLKIDFPRIPYPENKENFEHYRKYGEQLRKLHLMSDVPNSNVSFPVGGDCIVDKPIYDNGHVYINKTQYFDNVPQIAWNFYIGGYQPAQKYLKDRRGRNLSVDEVGHYEKIITVLCETDRIMKEIG